MSTFLFIPIFSPIFPKHKREEILLSLAIEQSYIIANIQELNKEGLELEPKKLIFFIGSGGTENSTLDFLKEIERDLSIILLSYPLNNSLPAAMEIRTYLDLKGYDVRIIHGSLSKLTEVLKNYQEFDLILSRIKGSRIGIVGDPSEWLIASNIDESSVKNDWGVEIIRIPIEELLSIKNQTNQYKTKEYSSKFIENAQKTDVSEIEVKKAGVVVDRLQSLYEIYNLDALTVKCFDLVLDTEITSCFAMSHLNDEGMVLGCEGDIPTTFTMFLIRTILNQPTFMANVIDVNEEENSVRFAHCTVPNSMVQNYSITTHFETGKSVAIKGEFEPSQQVTILKVGGADLKDYWMSKGTVIQNLSEPDACRTQIDVQLDGTSVKYFLESSIANHHCIVLGDYQEKLERFFEFFTD